MNTENLQDTTSNNKIYENLFNLQKISNNKIILNTFQKENKTKINNETFSKKNLFFLTKDTKNRKNSENTIFEPIPVSGTLNLSESDKIKELSEHLHIDTNKICVYPEKNSSIKNSINFFKKINKKTLWTSEEDNKLIELITEFGKKNWSKISTFFTNKSRKQCFMRWRKYLNKEKSSYGEYRINSSIPEIKENFISWTEREDDILLRWVKTMGVKNWTKCSKLIKNKTPKNCRDRWLNKVSFEAKPFESEIWNKKDEFVLLLLIRKFGTCWSKIMKYFENKTQNNIKNKFYCLARKALKNYPNLETNENQNLQNKIELIIKFCLSSNDANIYNQNLGNFSQAKKFVSEILMHQSNNKHLDNCLNTIKNNNEAEKNEFYNKKTLNICSGCMINLRNHIKRKIILKIKESNLNVDSDTLKKILKNSFEKFNNKNTKTISEHSTNFINGQKKNDNNINLNINLDNYENSNKNIDVIKNIPKLFEFINTIKDKIMN